MTAAFAPTWALAAVACLACGWAACVDARTRRLPNPLVACVALSALAQLVLCNFVGMSQPPCLPGIAERLISAAGTVAVLLAAGAAWRLLRGQRGMGMGDVKLLGALALWLGAGVFVALGCACLLALAVNLPHGRTTFAFGPYLCICGCFLLACMCVAL